jgi:NADH-quinone oxidoreductase subunit D
MVLEMDQELEVVDMPINMGPQHPSTHGVFRMVLVINGEKVVDVTPHIGYMHRGGEKLMEAMDYRQGIGYADRTEYLAQFSAELCYVMAVERLMDLKIPDRAEYIRVILTELNRMSSHFMFMGAFGIDSGLFGTSFTYAFREREYLQDIFEEVSGRRVSATSTTSSRATRSSWRVARTSATSAPTAPSPTVSAARCSAPPA